MKKINKILPTMSLKTFVFLWVMILSVLITLICSYGVNGMFYDRYKNEMLDKLDTQSNVLVTDLRENKLIIEKGSTTEANLYAIASNIDGRVMIVNSDYLVIGDSNGVNLGSIIINEDIMKAIEGKTKPIVREEKGYLQYVRGVEIDGYVAGVVMFTASLRGLDDFTNVYTGKNALYFGVIFVVCIIFAGLLGVASVRGIRNVNKRMQFLGEGHFDEKIPVKGFKEIQEVTKSYNDTITKLMEIDSTRQEFVSNVSHELKTPITSMKVLADSLIQNEDADLPMYKEFMTDIVDEIDRESQIINDLLTLVKFDKKSAEMNIAETNINELLEIILKRVTPIAKSRGIEITYESYRDVVAMVDEVKLGLALSNIIENAVKYNVDNGWVKVTLNADHKNFHIKVADSGVGIPDDCKDKVFERFYRVDKARSRDTGGTGLGLAITRNVILLHKGNIKLYSESGEGTTFTIKVPINN